MQLRTTPTGWLAAACLGLVLGTACGDDDPVAADEPITVDVYFALTVDGPGLQLNNMIYTTPAGTPYSIKVLRFIISDIALHTDEGGTVALKGVHFYDVADGTTQTFRVTGLPHADFTGLSFTFGLDETKNLRDRYQSYTKLHTLMQWPTGMGATLGYHYLQLEGNYEVSPGTTAAYTTHTGAHQVDGVDPAPHHYHFTVDAPFTPVHVHEGGHGELQIHINLNGWYLDHTPADGVDSAYDFKTLGDQMIMGNAEAQAKLQANGPFCFTATLAAHDAPHDH